MLLKKYTVALKVSFIKYTHTQKWLNRNKQQQKNKKKRKNKKISRNLSRKYFSLVCKQQTGAKFVNKIRSFRKNYSKLHKFI